MHNYRVAAAVGPGSAVVAVRNGDGVIEAFTGGPDGTVWHYGPDPSAASGYSGASTGAKADTFNALCDSDGTLVLFTASGFTLSYLTRKRGDSSWSAPTTISYTTPTATTVTAIDKITIGDIGGRYYIGVLLKTGNLQRPLNYDYYLTYSVWDPASIAFTTTASSSVSDRCVWLGTDAASASFVWVDAPEGVTRYSIAQREAVTAGADQSLHPAVSVSATTAPGAAAEASPAERIFAVTSDDKRVYEFVPGSGAGGNGSWAVRSPGGATFWIAPGTLEALKPGRMQGHGGTEEVPG